MSDLQKVQTPAALADRLEALSNLEGLGLLGPSALLTAAADLRSLSSALQSTEAELALMNDVSDKWYDTATEAILARKAALRDLAEMTRRAERAEAEVEALLYTPRPVDPDVAALIEAETARADQAERERDEARVVAGDIVFLRRDHPGQSNAWYAEEAVSKARSVLTGEMGE